MSRKTLFACLIVLLGASSTADAQGANCGLREGLAYFRGVFSINIARSPNAAFALFDANGESRWDPTWSPKFLHGNAYEVGSIFQTHHDGYVATWLVDSYDSQRKSVAYVVLFADRSIMKIAIALVQTGSGSRADVYYERTALNDAGKLEVGKFCMTFPRRQGEWQTALDGATK